MKENILVLPGDGIGPEIIKQSVKILNKVNDIYNLNVDLTYDEVGGAAYEIYGTPLSDETINRAKKSKAVLLGAVGGSQWDNLDVHLRPEQGLLRLRQALEVFANIRPISVFNELIDSSPLKPDLIRNLDFVIVRELLGGVYFGEHNEMQGVANERFASDVMHYNEQQIINITVSAFEFAQKRRKKVTLIDKANVLATSRMWRVIASEVAKQFADVELKFMYVDNAAMQLIINPKSFDVILTENMFGDILSDEASVLTGSIGMLASASFGKGIALYEPSHGSAPDIAGKNLANPIATILSVAMLVRYSLKNNEAASSIENAVRSFIKDGFRTNDLANNSSISIVSTNDCGNLILDRIQ